MIHGVAFVRVFVADLSTAVRFYTEDLGFALDFADDELGWAQFATDGTTLAVERVSQDEDEFSALVGRFVGVTFGVDDMAATYERLQQRGVRFSGPPEQAPWGGVLAHLHDPDDNVLTLMEAPSES